MNMTSRETFTIPKDVDKRKVQKTELEKTAEPTFKWVPQQSRIRIELLPEELSSIIKVVREGEVYVPARILELGPYVGYEDVVVEVIDADAAGALENRGIRHAVQVVKRKKLVNYKVGDIVLVNKSQVIRYTGADGIEHIFLKNESYICARQEPL